MFSSELSHSQSTQFDYGDNEDDNEEDDQATTFDVNSQQYSQPLLPPPAVKKSDPLSSLSLLSPVSPQHQKLPVAPQQTVGVQKSTPEEDIPIQLIVEDATDPILSQLTTAQDIFNVDDTTGSRISLRNEVSHSSSISVQSHASSIKTAESPIHQKAASTHKHPSVPNFEEVILETSSFHHDSIDTVFNLYQEIIEKEIQSVLSCDLSVHALTREDLTKKLACCRLAYSRALSNLKSTNKQMNGFRELLVQEKELKLIGEFKNLANSLLKTGKNKVLPRLILMFCPFPCKTYVKRWSNDEMVKHGMFPGQHNCFCNFTMQQLVKSYSESLPKSGDSTLPMQFNNPKFMKLLWLDHGIGIQTLQALSRARSDQLGFVKKTLEEEACSFHSNEDMKQYLFAKIFYATLVLTENKECWELMMRMFARLYHITNCGGTRDKFEEYKFSINNKPLQKLMPLSQIAFYILSIRKVACTMGDLKNIVNLSSLLSSCVLHGNTHPQLGGINSADIYGPSKKAKNFASNTWNTEDFLSQGYNQYHLNLYMEIFHALSATPILDDKNALLMKFERTVSTQRNVGPSRSDDRDNIFTTDISSNDCSLYLGTLL